MSHGLFFEVRRCRDVTRNHLGPPERIFHFDSLPPPPPTRITTLELFFLVNTSHGTDSPGVEELSPGNLKGGYKFVDFKSSVLVVKNKEENLKGDDMFLSTKIHPFNENNHCENLYGLLMGTTLRLEY